MSKLEVVTRVPEDEQHQSDVESVRVHGGKVFTCGDDGKVKYVRPKMLTSAPKDDLETVIIHGDRVFTCSHGGMVKIFDMDLKLLKEFKAHDCAVYDVFVFGDTLFTCSVDTTIKTWDLQTLELKKTITEHTEAVRKFCTNGKLIYAGDEKGEVRGYTPDGEMAVWYGVVEEVWSLHAQDDLLYSVRDRGVTITKLKGESNKFSICQSIRGRAPIYATNDLLLFPDDSGLAVDVRDNHKASLFALKGQLKGTEMLITALSGYGTRALSGAWDKEIRLWDLETLTEIGKCPVPDAPNSIAVSEQGDAFVVGSGGYICKLKCS